MIDRKHRLIITNVHVVGDNKTVTIYFPEFDDKGDLIIKKDEYKKKSGLTGTVVAREPRCDLALVQLDKLPPNVAPLPITKTKCLPAQQVHTVGNPGASKFLWIYSPGKIRQVGHDKWQVDDHEGKVYTYEGIKIETDSAINPGDSGGPLVNERGSLVGVVHAGNILAQNMSMFIEFSEVRALMETYYKSIGETWVPEPEPFVNEIPVAQITDWIKRLNHEDVNQRYKAAQTLGSMGPEGSHAFGALFKALKDSESIVRNAAADALEKVPPHKDDVGSLASALQDENEPLLVRQYAIKALVRLGGYGRPAMPALLAIALGNQESLRKESLLAAASIGPEGSDLPQLLKLVKGSNTDSRRKACTILAKMGEQAGPAVAELATLLKDKDQAVRLDVARALVGMGTAAKDAAKALVESLKDQDLEVAVQAARALIHLGDVKPGVALLSNNLKAPNLDLRKECVIGLGEAGPDAKAFAKDLVTLFEEDSLRPIAQESLLKIGKPALPSVVARLNVLMKNTGTSNPKARLACIHCLRDFDQATAEVGNALLLVGRLDPVAENRQAAEAAFRKLGGGTNPTTPGKGGPTAGAGN